MAVRIRLTRIGATKQPSYRFVVADSRSARDGRTLDILGHYDPRQDPVEILLSRPGELLVDRDGRLFLGCR